jgi:hypothetical protein
MNSIPMPRGRIPSALDNLRPKLAAAAMSIYDDWQQIDGMDIELGAGGICQDVASAMTGSLSEAGFEHMYCVHASVGENHVFVVVLVPGDGVYEIDIPPSVYEVGSGYVWKKREGITIGENDVVIGKIADDMDEDAFADNYAYD